MNGHGTVEGHSSEAAGQFPGEGYSYGFVVWVTEVLEKAGHWNALCPLTKTLTLKVY